MPPDHRPNIDVGYKFGLLSLPRVRPGGGVEASFEVGPGLAMTTSLPQAKLDRWKEWIGSLRLEEIEQAGTYLIAVEPSARPHVLDSENKHLRARVVRYHTGLLVAVPFMAHGEAAFVTGGNDAGETDVREFTTYPMVRRAPGVKSGLVTASRAREALRLAAALESLEGGAGSPRIPRILTAFRRAVGSRELDERVHQFVRCVEGFVGGNDAATFAHNASQLVKGNHRDLLRHLYRIRSSTEHLSGPWRDIGGTQEQQLTTLVERAIQAETLARFALHVFLINPTLWPHMHDEKSVAAFWQLPGRERQRLWPTKLVMDRALDDLDRDRALRECTRH
jgi:hypothetical protein